jgi:hypothetical protein
MRILLVLACLFFSLVLLGSPSGNMFAADDNVVRRVTCPATIKTGSTRNLGDWNLPAGTARFARARLETRDLGGRPYYSAVCYYSAYRGEVSIERVMGNTGALRNCQVFTQQGGTGGVTCD